MVQLDVLVVVPKSGEEYAPERVTGSYGENSEVTGNPRARRVTIECYEKAGVGYFIRTPNGCEWKHAATYHPRTSPYNERSQYNQVGEWERLIAGNQDKLHIVNTYAYDVPNELTLGNYGFDPPTRWDDAGMICMPFELYQRRTAAVKVLVEVAETGVELIQNTFGATESSKLGTTVRMLPILCYERTNVGFLIQTPNGAEWSYRFELGRFERFFRKNDKDVLMEWEKLMDGNTRGLHILALSRSEPVRLFTLSNCAFPSSDSEESGDESMVSLTFEAFNQQPVRSSFGVLDVLDRVCALVT